MTSEEMGGDSPRFTLKGGRMESIELGRSGKPSDTETPEKNSHVKTSVLDYASPVEIESQGSSSGSYAVRKLGVLEDCDSGV